MLCPSCRSVEIPEGSQLCKECSRDRIGNSPTEDPSERVKPKEGKGDPAVPAGAPGKGRYEILELLGEGGMGKVYKAKDKGLDIVVALKRLLKDSGGQEKGLSRFLREPKAIAALEHPNIIRIYDIGKDEEGHYISMEYAEDTLLRRIKEKKRLSVQETVDIARQIGRALDYAHRKRVIHRDVKPSNILITSAGIPKLADFGLAKIDDGLEISGTSYGLGDRYYMAPEQMGDARNVDHRADIYGLGVTMYQMVTGEMPVTIRESKIPEALRGVILKAIEEKPENRYSTAEELVKDLEQIGRTTVQKQRAEGRGEGSAKKEKPEEESSLEAPFFWGFLNWLIPPFGLVLGGYLLFAKKSKRNHRSGYIVMMAGIAGCIALGLVANYIMNKGWDYYGTSILVPFYMGYGFSLVFFYNAAFS